MATENEIYDENSPLLMNANGISGSDLEMGKNDTSLQETPEGLTSTELVEDTEAVHGIGDELAGDITEVQGVEHDEAYGAAEVASSRKKTKKMKKKSKKNQKAKVQSEIIIALEQEVAKSLAQHNLAYEWLNYRQFNLFTVPTAVMTCFASVFAFVATSDLFTPRQNTLITTCVGAISAFVVFVQTVGGVLNYGARAAMHKSAAIDLRDLRDDLTLLKAKLSVIEQNQRLNKITVDMSNESMEAKKADDDDDSDDEEEPFTGNFETIQSRYRQSLSSCKSTVPMKISEAFNGLKSNIQLTMSKKNVDVMYGIYGHTLFDDYIITKAYDILAGEIINHKYFPMHLPSSKIMVEKTMERLMVQLQKYPEVYEQMKNEV